MLKLSLIIQYYNDVAGVPSSNFIAMGIASEVIRPLHKLHGEIGVGGVADAM